MHTWKGGVNMWLGANLSFYTFDKNSSLKKKKKEKYLSFSIQFMLT